jgi:nitroreductase
MDVEDAIRERRTIKAFAPEPVSRELLDELLSLARWAPNHHLTNPWRFRVVGSVSLLRLKAAAGPEAAGKLDRAPTLVAVTVVNRGADRVQSEEDLCATACATYAVLLAAHGRGLAGYWRTPGVLRTQEGRAALRIPDDERFVALIHLGRPREEMRREPPARAPHADVVTYLD